MCSEVLNIFSSFITFLTIWTCTICRITSRRKEFPSRTWFRNTDATTSTSSNTYIGCLIKFKFRYITDIFILCIFSWWFKINFKSISACALKYIFVSWTCFCYYYNTFFIKYISYLATTQLPCSWTTKCCYIRTWNICSKRLTKSWIIKVTYTVIYDR